MPSPLGNFYSIHSAYFVRIDVPTYQVLRFSNFDRSYDINFETYSELGKLLSVSGSSSELRANEQEVTVVLSGIPSGSVSEVLDNPMKGSEIIIYRGFFDPVTGQLLDAINNPGIKFKGIIQNVSLTEEIDQSAKRASFSINLICVSHASLLTNKIAGRRTNPLDEKKFFPNDLSFDRVPTLKNSNFQFGAPKSVTTAGLK